MAGIRAAQVRRDTTEGTTVRSFKAGTTGDYGLTPFSEVGSGKPHDPEKRRLAEIIARLNDLCCAEVSDDDNLRLANGIADRIERDEAVISQSRNHSEDQMIHGLFPKQLTDAVLDALSDHEKLKIPLLEDEETGRQFALLILQLLEGRTSRKVYAGKESADGFHYD